jgi:hypothetical protein
LVRVSTGDKLLNGFHVPGTEKPPKTSQFQPS